MTAERYSTHRTPLFIIKTCSCDENDVLMSIASPTPSSKPAPVLTRSLSLPDCRYIYKDLTGVIHQSSWTNGKERFRRSNSIPERFFIEEKQSTVPTFDGASILTMNLLDPMSGLHSPGESSSRYSLYGSFFDLSENGYSSEPKFFPNIHPTFHLLAPTNKLSIHNYQDKCTDWLSRIDL